jgi:hypothetical protein
MSLIVSPSLPFGSLKTFVMENSSMSSHAQRRASRANGRASHGPVTPFGRLRSDQARITHGLTAKAHAVIPGEDPDELADFVQRLFDELNPIGELQNEIFGRLATACLLRRRGDRALTAKLKEQVQTALDNLRRRLEDEFNHFRELFRAFPGKRRAEGLAGLRQSSLGCLWLIQRWLDLRAALVKYGLLAAHELREMSSLLDERLGRDTNPTPRGFWLSVHAFLCNPHRRPHDPESPFGGMAPGQVDMYCQAWADPAANRAELLRVIDEAIAELRAREESLRTGPEAVAQALAAEQALVIQDPTEARLRSRYAGDHQSMFYRAYRELKAVQAEAAQEAEAEDEEDEVESAPAEAAPEAQAASAEAAEEAPAETFSNEPGAPGAESQEAVVSGSCVTNPGNRSETVRNAILEALRAGPAAGLLKPSARSSPGGF